MSMRKMAERLKGDEQRLQMASADVEDEDEDEFRQLVVEDEGESDSSGAAQRRKDRPQHHRHRRMLVCLFSFYAIATVFQLYHGSGMTRKPEPTLLLIQRIFNFPHHRRMV